MKFVTWLLLVALLLMAGVSVHQATVIEDQRHTIRQYMGLEDGPDATPRPAPNYYHMIRRLKTVS